MCSNTHKSEPASESYSLYIMYQGYDSQFKVAIDVGCRGMYKCWKTSQAPIHPKYYQYSLWERHTEWSHVREMVDLAAVLYSINALADRSMSNEIHALPIFRVRVCDVWFWWAASKYNYNCGSGGVFSLKYNTCSPSYRYRPKIPVNSNQEIYQTHSSVRKHRNTAVKYCLAQNFK